jgi:hypothetical protein
MRKIGCVTVAVKIRLICYMKYSPRFLLLIKDFFPVALQSFRTLAASHIGGFLSYLNIW